MGSNFPHGIEVGGVPILPGIGGNIFTGSVFYVDSGNTNASNTAGQGTDTSFPFSTIDFAIGQTTADNGDVILVLPGHNESITAATSLVMDVAGVTVLGVGVGRSRPILDFDNTAGSIEMDAANTRLSNVILRASVTATVIGINVDADDVMLDNLEFTYEATGDDFITMVDVDAFDRTLITDCVFRTEPSTAGAGEAIRLDDTINARIENNRFSGQWADAVIQMEGALSSEITIKNNVIYNSDTSVYNGISTGTLSSTGIVAGNNITALYATGVAKIYRDGDLTSHDNSWANALSERSSILVPATSSG